MVLYLILINTRLCADFSVYLKVYSFKVSWSDGTTNIIYRRYSEVHQLEVKTTSNHEKPCDYFYVPIFHFSLFILLILIANEMNLLKVVAWLNFHPLICYVYLIQLHKRIKKSRLPFANICISSGEILVWNKCVKYANEMTSGTIHSRANVANLQLRPSKVGSLLVLKKTHLQLQNIMFPGHY